jgi:hypothetical protein
MAPMDTDLKVWLDHFEYHASRRCVLPAGRTDDLTPWEQRLIADSIATFQLGEQSEGRSLLNSAKAYEQACNAAPLARIVELLIAEEQHHAALLGAFMDQHGIPRKRRDWTDWIFRCVRRVGGFELHLAVLMAAELIGKVYYRAVEAATGCMQLQTLCRMLVADELAHVGLESDLLREMQGRRSLPIRTVITMLYRTFFASASLVVWFTHRRVLRAAGYRMSSFLRACGAQYRFYLEPPPIRASSDFTAGMTRLEEADISREQARA